MQVQTSKSPPDRNLQVSVCSYLLSLCRYLIYVMPFIYSRAVGSDFEVQIAVRLALCEADYSRDYGCEIILLVIC